MFTACVGAYLSPEDDVFTTFGTEREKSLLILIRHVVVGEEPMVVLVVDLSPCIVGERMVVHFRSVLDFG